MARAVEYQLLRRVVVPFEPVQIDEVHIFCGPGAKARALRARRRDDQVRKVVRYAPRAQKRR